MKFIDIIINKDYSGYNPVVFGHQECPASWSYGPAVRPYWLLHYVHDGKGIFIRDNKTHTVQKGEIFVIPPFVETYYEADKKDPWKYTWIGFDADEKSEKVFDEPVIRRPGTNKIFDDMKRCFEMENGKGAFLSSKIWELIALLMESDKSTTSHIDKAISMMQSEYSSGITVAEIAKQLNLDRCYFSALFKKETGISPIDYLTELKLRKAAELISIYGKSPTTAAISVGYADYCHFSKAFKKIFGCAPRKYSETFKKD